MVTFVLIVSFPVILMVGFGGLYVVAYASPHGKEALDRIVFLLYPAFLAIPVGAALLAGWRNGHFEQLGMAPPRIASLEPGAGLLVSLGTGILTGIALFYNELGLSKLLQRWTRSAKGLRRALEGGVQEFVEQQEHLPTGLTLALSATISGAEELLWRGYLIHYLTDALSLSVVVAVLLSAVSFGLNHYYFGLRNVALKMLSGGAWGLLMVTTGSLVAPFASHLAFDLMARRRLQR